jgi:anthranilate synthase/aminodeoxychorismate synthase-like glutamine amidotransferase
MILLIDNYDSFTYNLFQYLEELGEKVITYRNDEISIKEIERLDPKYIVISPGPSTPWNSGVTVDLIRAFYDKKPILGVCLGHQAIAYAFGGSVVRAPIPVHGKLSCVYHNEDTLYRGIPNPFSATRYHSLMVKDLPPELLVCSWTEDNIIMGIRHKDYPVFGVQFHPESYMTEIGKRLLLNFLEEV